MSIHVTDERQQVEKETDDNQESQSETGGFVVDCFWRECRMLSRQMIIARGSVLYIFGNLYKIAKDVVV